MIFCRSSVQLSRGIHTLQLHVRFKGPFSFTCSINLIEGKQTWQVLSPSFLPDLVNGKLFSRFISILITNLHGSHWLKVTKVSTVKESLSSSQFTLKMLAEDKTFMIAPGQVRPIKLVLEYKNGMEQQNDGSVCSDVKMVLKIGTNKGQDQMLTVNLRCRKLSESFLFTFVDHDGSIQHGAAIAPWKGCASGSCPVLLTLHGTSKCIFHFIRRKVIAVLTGYFHIFLSCTSSEPGRQLQADGERQVGVWCGTPLACGTHKARSSQLGRAWRANSNDSPKELS